MILRDLRGFVGIHQSSIYFQTRQSHFFMGESMEGVFSGMGLLARLKFQELVGQVALRGVW
ncbi:MAG: hypothetical protein APF82_10675 [Sphingomonadales bacterium BRH_c42]|nr:MAG: hypothetical protein APF82_10675 [Sphingomonadales bacterium BRH_c42]